MAKVKVKSKKEEGHRIITTSGVWGGVTPHGMIYFDMFIEKPEAPTETLITIDERTLMEIDRLVSEHRFANRSRVIQEAVDEKLLRLSHSRLAAECAKLDPAFERALAEEASAGELEEWPEY